VAVRSVGPLVVYDNGAYEEVRGHFTPSRTLSPYCRYRNFVLEILLSITFYRSILAYFVIQLFFLEYLLLIDATFK
jgi:hypothetical protein